MKILHTIRGSHRAYDQATSELIDEAATTYIQPQDGVQAVAADDSMTTYVDELWGHRADAQPPLHDADGEAQARRATKTAAETNFEAEANKNLAAEELSLAVEANHQVKDAERELRPHTRRGKSDLLIYYLVLVALVSGDSTGIALPLISSGEVPYLAILQSISAAVAMVVSGLAGRALKDAATARHRAKVWPDGPPEHLDKYATRFRGNTRTPWVPITASLAIGVIPIAIGLLRYSVSGPAWGLTFGLIALGVMAASGAASYWITDDVSDLLDGYHKAAHKAARRARRAAASRAISIHADAEAEAASIKAEASLRGRGAELETLSLSPLVKSNNGHIFGHGLRKSVAPTPPPTILLPAAPNGHEPVQP